MHASSLAIMGRLNASHGQGAALGQDGIKHKTSGPVHREGQWAHGNTKGAAVALAVLESVAGSSKITMAVP